MSKLLFSFGNFKNLNDMVEGIDAFLEQHIFGDGFRYAVYVVSGGKSKVYLYTNYTDSLEQIKLNNDVNSKVVFAHLFKGLDDHILCDIYIFKNYGEEYERFNDLQLIDSNIYINGLYEEHADIYQSN